MNGYKVIAWSSLISSIGLLALPRILPVCTGRTEAGGQWLPMVCHYAYQAEFIIGLLAVIAAAGLLVLRTAEGKLFASLLVLLLGLAIIIIPQPWAVGICPEGACHKTTFFVTIGGIFFSLTGAVSIWLVRKAGQGEAT